MNTRILRISTQGGSELQTDGATKVKERSEISDLVHKFLKLSRLRIGRGEIFDMCIATTEIKMGVHCRSDGRQELSDIRTGLPKAAAVVHLTVMLSGLAFSCPFQPPPIPISTLETSQTDFQ